MTRAAVRKNISGYYFGVLDNSLLLDLYPGAAVAYSFRRLSSTYYGKAVRIRRSSDNAERDFGFVQGGDFDTASASSFIGGGSGFIVTWYDQSGTGYNLTQATAARQPIYRATGLNSLPTAEYEARSSGPVIHRLQGSTDGLSFDGTALTCFVVATIRNNDATYDGRVGRIVSMFGSGATADWNNTNSFMISRQDSTNGISGFLNSAEEQARAISFLTPFRYALRYNNTDNDSFLNTSKGTSDTNSAPDFGNTTATFAVGGEVNETSAIDSLSGYVSEVILYQSAQSDANAAAIQTNQAYWGF